MRRYLYFDIDEWQALPWWQQEVYLDELQYDEPWQREACGMAKLPDKPPREHEIDDLDDIGSQQGVKVRRRKVAHIPPPA